MHGLSRLESSELANSQFKFNLDIFCKIAKKRFVTTILLSSRFQRGIVVVQEIATFEDSFFDPNVTLEVTLPCNVSYLRVIFTESVNNTAILSLANRGTFMF